MLLKILHALIHILSHRLNSQIRLVQVDTTATSTG
jgi:hypothetical protein